MTRVRQRLTAWITRRYPFLSGCATFANSRLLRRVVGAGRGTTWTRLRGGANILVPLDDYVGRAAYFTGDLDRKVSAVVRRLVRPGDCVLDVGANLGVVTLPLARLVGPQGVVHSFEPNPSIAALLRQSLDRNRFSNVRLHPFALGAEEGTLDLAVPSDNAGQATLDAARSADGWKRVKVRVRTLAALADEIDLPRVRLMKIDVEGHERDVFRGGDRWLAAHPPDAIVFESNNTPTPGKADPVAAFLAERGYALYALPKRLFRLCLTPYRVEGNDAAEGGGPTASHDLLAVYKASEREIVSRFTVRAGH